MNLINFVIWLSAGAVIGWLACRMVEEEKRRLPIPLSRENQGSLKS